MSALTFRERPPDGDPAGLLVLHHGRGADEHDLLPLADVLDPGRRLHVVTPRAPLTLPGWPGHHWYVVPRVGFPDHDTFHAAYRALATLHDELWERTGITRAHGARRVLDGLGDELLARPRAPTGRLLPGILAFSGFVPAVDGWQPDLAGRPALRAFIAHGRRDPIMPVEFAHRARDLLQGAGLRSQLPRVRRRPPHRSGPPSGRRRVAARSTLGLEAGTGGS